MSRALEDAARDAVADNLYLVDAVLAGDRSSLRFLVGWAGSTLRGQGLEPPPFDVVEAEVLRQAREVQDVKP